MTGANNDLVSSFLSAIQIFSKEITGDNLEIVTIDKTHMFFHKDLRDPSILYVIITDITDESEFIKVKILKIADLFYTLYSELLIDFKGVISPFLAFGDLLVSMKVATRNCGKSLECRECTEQKKVSKTLKNFQKIKREKNSNYFQSVIL